MTVYIYTPEQHAQIVDAVSCKINSPKYGVSQIALDQASAMLKAMQPVSPCAKLKPCQEGWFIDLDNAPPLTGETMLLYTPTKD